MAVSFCDFRLLLLPAAVVFIYVQVSSSFQFSFPHFDFCDGKSLILLMFWFTDETLRYTVGVCRSDSCCCTFLWLILYLLILNLMCVYVDAREDFWFFFFFAG